MIVSPALVPELGVSSLRRSLRIYQDVFGFELLAERFEEAFAYLAIGDAHLMLQEATGPGRRFRTAPLDPPFGRGANLQIGLNDVDACYRRTVDAMLQVVVSLEDRWYRQGEFERGNRQFVVADPDGYLLRFYEDRGVRRPLVTEHAETMCSEPLRRTADHIARSAHSTPELPPGRWRLAP